MRLIQTTVRWAQLTEQDITVTNGGTVTVLAAATDVVTVTLTKIDVGDILICQPFVTFTKGGVAGDLATFLTTKANPDVWSIDSGVTVYIPSVGAGAFWQEGAARVVVVTAAPSQQGDLVLQASSSGSNSTAAIGARLRVWTIRK